MVVSTQSCPSCSEPVQATSVRCGACGQVLGEDNRCDRCHALAPVIERGERVVCSACGAERERGPSTIVVPESEVLAAFERSTVLPWLLLVGGLGMALAGAALSIALGLLSESGVPRAVAIFVAIISVASGGFAALFGARLRRRALRKRHFEMEQRIIGLAYQNEGLLRAEEVSRRLRLPLAEADQVLSDLAREGRAASRITQAGEVEYTFGEAKRTRGLRVRNSQSS